jgi:hypothetical protein
MLAEGHFLKEPYRSYLNEALSGGKRKIYCLRSEATNLNFSRNEKSSRNNPRLIYSDKRKLS